MARRAKARPQGKLVVGALVAGLLLMAGLQAGEARAETTVTGLPGGVLVWGDDNPHSWQVWLSDTDTIEREQGNGGQADFPQATNDAAQLLVYQAALLPIWNSEAASKLIAQLEKRRTELTQLVDSLPEGISQQGLDEIQDAYQTASTALSEVKAYGRLANRFASFATRIDNLKTSITSEELDSLRSALSGLEFDLTQIQNNVDAALSDMRLAEARLSTQVPSEIRASLRNFSRVATRFARRSKQRGFATLGFMKWLGWFAVIGDVAYSFYTALSQDRVLIRDKTGNPIRGRALCRTLPRSTASARLSNTVACPITHFPFAAATASANLLVGLVVGLVEWVVGGLPTRGLYMVSGSGKDRIYLDIDPAKNPFSNVLVNGGGNNDTIRGSAVDERLIGGDGHDTILGKGGDDAIYGGSWVFGTPAGTNDNDQLFGGDGNDTIDGEDGDDLIFGGGGDDDLYGNFGNDAIVGGPGQDDMDGGEGIDSIFAKESDFPTSTQPGAPPQADEVDAVVDCGDDYPSPAEQYVVTGPSEVAYNCPSNPLLPPFTPPTLDELLNDEPVGGWWPWFR